MELPVKIGDQVEPGGLIGRIAARDRAAADRAAAELPGLLTFSGTPVDPPPLVVEEVGV